MMQILENDNIQWCKLGPRAMFGKFILDIAKMKKITYYFYESGRY